MAEQEVIKHTKKITGIWKNRDHGLMHKLKEFITEIVIIVFAVSLSIWFHNWSEHRHEQEDVKKFLLGLREDLLNDIGEMKGDMESYQMQSRAFNYVTGRKWKEPLNMDSISAYSNYLYNTTSLIPNNGRFEGFKSSGKFGKIENDKLQIEIMDLYQEDIPALLSSTNNYTETKRTFFRFIQMNRKRTSDSTTNILDVLSMDEAQNICAFLTGVNEILFRYNRCVQASESIIHEIEQDYHLEAASK